MIKIVGENVFPGICGTEAALQRHQLSEMRVSEQKQLFLSYRSVELDFALRLAADLKNAGVHLWIDRLDIRPGEDWRKAIQRAVNQCEAMISVITPEYVTSRYCQNELARADRMGRPIIPVLLRPLPETEWPFELERQQYIDFSGWRNDDIYQARFNELLQLVQQQFSAQLGGAPPAESQYLTRLIADLEATKGVTEHIDISAASDQWSDLPTRPEPRFAEAWTLQGALAVLPTESTAQQSPIRLNGIVEALDRFPRFVLVGTPGAGKTTTLQSLALNAARTYLAAPEATPLPIVLKLANWIDQPSAEAFVRDHWPLDTDPIVLLAKGKARLYLDGLNEMPDPAVRADLLRVWFDSAHAPQYAILTCRAEDYRDDLTLALPVVQAAQMDRAQIEQFVASYLGAAEANQLIERILPLEQDASAQHVYQLASNPILLSVLVMMYQSAPDAELPMSKGALIKQLVAELWHQENLRQSEERLSFEPLEGALADLAFHMIDEDMPIYVPLTYAQRFLNDVAWLPMIASARIVEQQGSSVRFSHQFIQEYFAALGLVRAGLPTRLRQPTFDASGQRITTKWDTVIGVLCGITSDADSVVRAIAEVDPYLALEAISSGVAVADATCQQTVARLLGVVQQDDADGLVSAAAALAAMQHESALPVLLNALRGGSWETRTAGTQLLKQLPTSSFPGFPGVLEDLHPDAQVSHVLLLRQLGPSALPILVQTLSSEQWALRRGAAWALGELGDRAGIPALIEALYDDEALVQAEAAYALGAIADSSAIPALVEAVQQGNWRVRKAAISALGRIGQPALESLIAMLHVEAENVRRLAIDALKLMDAADTLSALLRASYDSSAEVRGAALEALADTEDVRAVNRLIESLSDMARSRWSKLRISDIAARLLKKIGTHEAKEALRRWENQAPAASASPAAKKAASTSGGSAPIGKERLQAAIKTATAESAVDRFRDLTSPEWDLRRRAVEALHDVEPSIALPKLLTALKDTDSHVRLAATQVLSNYQKNELARDGLLAVLGDSESVVSDAAAIGLRNFGKFAVPGLMKTLKSESASARGAAADVLGKLGDGVAVPALIELLSDTARPWMDGNRVCDTVASALLQIGSTEACEAVNKWRSEKRGQAAQSLTVSSLTPALIDAINARERADGEPAHRERLVELLDTVREGEWGERQEAAKQLRDYARKLHGKDTAIDLQRLTSALDDRDWVVRWAASEAVAWVGNTAVVPDLMKRVSDTSWMVRVAAIRALLELGDERAADAIRPALADENTNVRESAAEALGGLGDTAAVPALAKILEDNERFVRLAAVEALGCIGGEAAIRSLCGALDDEDRHVRWAAADSLRRVGDSSAVPALIAHLQDNDAPHWEQKTVSQVVAEALERIGTPEAVAALQQWQRV